MTLAAAIAAAVCAAAPGGPADGEATSTPRGDRREAPLRVECEGALEWVVSGGGAKGEGAGDPAGEDADARSVLRLSGGVRATRGEIVLRAARAEATFGADGSPDLVRAEGGVLLESPRFSARAGVARMHRVAAGGRGDEQAAGAAREDGGEGDGGGASYLVTLERGPGPAVVLRSGGVSLLCGGALVYDIARSTATLERVSGRIRGPREPIEARPEAGADAEGGAAGAGGGKEAQEPYALASCDRAEVRFRPRPPSAKLPAASGRPVAGKKPVGEAPEGPSGAEATVLPPVERVFLTGNVLVAARGGEGMPSRRIRAARAVYDAARGTVVFSGEPHPVVEYQSVVLTAPEVTLYVGENRVESTSGKMRAVIDSRGKGARPGEGREASEREAEPPGGPTSGPESGEDR